MSNQITVLNSSIRQLDNLYSLNDLHRVSGNDPKHRPSLFIRLEATKSLIDEIKTENSQSTDLIFGESHKIIRGGADCSVRGVWACEELALAYATWISPKFHLVVLRAFLNMHKQEVQPQQLALPEPRQEPVYNHALKESFLRNLAWLWYEAHQENELIARILPGLEAIASKHAPTAYSHKVEYGNHIRFMADQIYTLVKDIPFEHSYAPLRALEAVMQTKQTKRIYR